MLLSLRAKQTLTFLFFPNLFLLRENVGGMIERDDNPCLLVDKEIFFSFERAFFFQQLHPMSFLNDSVMLFPMIERNAVARM